MIEPLTRPLVDNRMLRLTAASQLQVPLGEAAKHTLPTLGRTFLDAIRGGQLFNARQADIGVEEFQRQARIAVLAEMAGTLTDKGEKDAAFAELQSLAQPTGTVTVATRQAIAAGTMISAEDLTAQNEHLGLVFDYALTPDQAKVVIDTKRAELVRQAVTARAPSGVVAAGVMFGANLLAMATDPLELATMFIPVVGQAGKAAAIARFGRVGGRVAVGAVEGGVGQALTEPLYYGLSRQMQLDYEMSDSLLNIGVGFVFGGGVGAVAGALARRGAVPSAPSDATNFAPEGRVESVLQRAPDEVESDYRAIEAQRAPAEISLRQFVTDQKIDLDGFYARQGVTAEYKRLAKEAKLEPIKPIAETLRRSRGIDPRGRVAEELAAQGIGAKDYPGLFRRGGATDLDNLPADEFEDSIPGISKITGVENGYISRQGLIDALVDELNGRGALGRGKVTAEIDDVTRNIKVYERIMGEADGQKFAVRSDAELEFLAGQVFEGKSIDEAFERLAILTESDMIENTVARSTAPIPHEAAASRVADETIAAKKYQSVDGVPSGVPDDIDDLQMIVNQMDLSPTQAADLKAANAMDEIGAARAEVANATAACMART